MDSSQQRLVAGLLTSLVSSTLVPSATTPSLASYSRDAHSVPPSSTAVPPDNHNGDGTGHMHEWSSLIGIITALVGNVLISLALNIQRYAHLRIAREWEEDKIKLEADWQRTHSESSTANQYGSVGCGDRNGSRGRSRNQDRRNGGHRFEAYRDEDTPRDRDDTRSRDSFGSDQTARPDDGGHQRKSYLKSPYWWVGIVLMCLGEMGNFMAYGFAPASIVSPLGVVALISNCIIAPCLLKEKFRSRDFWGVLVAIAGAVVVVLSAKDSEEKLGPDEIWMMITRWEFELYLGLTISLIIGLMWASFKYGSRSILIDVGLVALFGGYTALSTKGVSSLLSFTLWHAITFPITYLLVFVLVSSALMQIRYINRALQRFDSTQVIPIQFVLFTLSVIIGSAILYRDFESMTAARAAKFVGGCFLTFLGVYFITSGRIRSDNESTFSTEDEEEAIGLLHGERYHDRLDISPPGHQIGLSKGLRSTPGVDVDVGQSPSGSLISRGIEGIDENQLTPRGVLSASPSSSAGSLTAESTLSGPSPLRPPSRMSNPWADSGQALSTSRPDREVYRPASPSPPSPRAGDPPQESTVLLRFPPAPGAEDPILGDTPTTGRRASTPAAGNEPQVPLETPSRRILRNSLSHRFSPGPLLPTLSGGFSAVVAESLRRGEGSPTKDRGRRKLGRRRQLDGAFDREAGRYQDEALAHMADGDGHDSPLTVANARLQSAANLASPSAQAGHSSPALATEVYTAPTHKTDEEVTRPRSFSDSWSGGLAWLGGALKRSNPNVGSGAVAQGAVTPQAGEGSARGETDQQQTANAESETRT